MICRGKDDKYQHFENAPFFGELCSACGNQIHLLLAAYIYNGASQTKHCYGEALRRRTGPAHTNSRGSGDMPGVCACVHDVVQHSILVDAEALCDGLHAIRSEGTLGVDVGYLARCTAHLRR